ncbi:MAG: molybdopterin-dependent oxidoreductase [Alphaproteobacteria bacterium]|nr:molybdopterin-dependent oxidoreductase [Alphaproteobacteria bacterium]
MTDDHKGSRTEAGSGRRGPSRRLLLVGGLALGGGAALGVALWPYSRLPDQTRIVGREGAFVLSGAVRIARDGGVTVIYPHADMGTGNGTALAQLVAEEMDADWATVSIERAPADIAFANGALGQAFLRGDAEIPGFLAGPSWLVTRRIAEAMKLQITGGSTAVSMTGMEGMRYAGAGARYMLVRAAAKSWGVPPDEIEVRSGRLIHASGREAGFGDFAEASLEFTPPARLAYKSREAYRIVGQPMKRFDTPAKVTGQAIYSGDVRLPGMLFAAVRLCPRSGGTLDSVDPAPALSRRGVIKTVTFDTGFAVLADNFWRARTAADALEPRWSFPEGPGMNSQAVLAAMEAGLDGDGLKSDYSRGPVSDRFAAEGAKVVERTYNAPYLAHAAMETVGCVAHMHSGGLEIWGAFQDALGARYSAAKFAGLKPEAVVVHHTEMGGAFGRRINTDYLETAISVARQVDAPVNLIYSREEDMRHDFYRNASAARMRAVLGEDGRPTAISHTYAERHDPPDASHFPYDLEAVEARFTTGGNPAPWGAWRSVDHSTQGFFIESFIDELAAEAGQDPYLYRRALLEGNPRARAVLDAVADMSGWTANQTAPAKRSLGIAFKSSFGTFVAEVVEVEIAADGRIRTPRVWVAADPGLAVNPDGFAQQMESGVIYGLSAALYGEITFEDGQAVQSNFWDYPVLRMGESPRIEVRILQSGARTGGAGEPGTPPVAAAVANAVFAASGVRVRSLPLAKASLSGSV